MPDVEIFFPAGMGDVNRGNYIRLHLPVSRLSGLPAISCGWTVDGSWYMNFSVEPARPRYFLKYREAGKKPGTERWAKRDVHTVSEAIDFMNANKDRAFLPAYVTTRAWGGGETVAILG